MAALVVASVTPSPAKDAQHAARRGEPGWYVRNFRTRIIVRGPFDSREQAQLVAESHTDAVWEVGPHIWKASDVKRPLTAEERHEQLAGERYEVTDEGDPC